MEDNDFKREFIDRTAIYMGDFLNSAGTREIWDSMYEKIRTEYPYHRALVNQRWPNYGEELANARNWLLSRTANFYQQLATYYSLGTPTAMMINQSLTSDDLNKVKISINGVNLTKGTYNGKFFANRSVTLMGTPVDGKEVTGWNITQVSTSGVTNNKVDGSIYQFTMPTCSSLTINAILGNTNGINQISNRSFTWNVENGTLRLHGIQTGTKVSLYDMRGILCSQVTANGVDISIQLSDKLYILKVGKDAIKIVNSNE
jgi:hypothetical protein